MLAQARKHLPYCFSLAESAAADFSQTSLTFSYFSLKVLLSPHAVNMCPVAAGRPAFIGRLSPALYWLICTSPHAENVTNIGVNKSWASAKISLILAKLQQSVSLLIGVLSKIGKTKK
jgi:hypothetical protein